MEPFDINGTIKNRSYNVNLVLVGILKVVITSTDDAQTKEEIIPDAQITSTWDIQILVRWGEMLKSEIKPTKKKEKRIWSSNISINRSFVHKNHAWTKAHLFNIFLNGKKCINKLRTYFMFAQYRCICIVDRSSVDDSKMICGNIEHTWRLAFLLYQYSIHVCSFACQTIHLNYDSKCLMWIDCWWLHA